MHYLLDSAKSSGNATQGRWREDLPVKQMDRAPAKAGASCRQADQLVLAVSACVGTQFAQSNPVLSTIVA